jgi:hypothetical protein
VGLLSQPWAKRENAGDPAAVGFKVPHTARLANFQSSKATEPNLKFCTTTPLIIAYDKLKKNKPLSVRSNQYSLNTI